MNSNVDPFSVRRTAGIPIPVYAAHSIPVFALGMGLSLFLAISYVLCVLGYLFLPSLPIAHSALSIVLPGFTLLSWSSFCCFSVADITALVTVDFAAKAINFPVPDEHRSLKRWYDAISSRPSMAA